MLFHGMATSRLQFPDPSAAVDSGVLAVTVDRPGTGRSDPQPGHRMIDGAADVEALADELGFDRFGVIGWSAGSVYAYACAARMPDRLTGCAVTTSSAALCYLYDDPAVLDALAGDDDRAVMAALKEGRETAERLAAADGEEWVRSIAADPGQMLQGSDVGDEWFYEDADLRRNMIESVLDGFRQGAVALAPQWVAQLAPWGFRLEDLTIPVHTWCGANDVTRPMELVRRLAERVPEHSITVWDDVGHAGIAKYLRDVLAEL